MPPSPTTTPTPADPANKPFSVTRQTIATLHIYFEDTYRKKGSYQKLVSPTQATEKA